MEELPFEKCFIDVTGGNIKIKQSNYKETGQIPIIDQGKKLIGGYTDDKNTIVKCKIPCIIYGDHSRNVKYFDKDFAIGADGVKLLESTNKIIPKYGFYFLQTVKLPNAGYDRSFKYLKRINIPVPDVETQNKIVAILDKANGILDKREKTIAQYDELLSATFLDMFGNPMERPNQWKISPINDCIEKITAGSSYGGEDKKELQDDELGVIKISAVTKGIFNPEEYKAVKKDKIKKQLVHPRKGDLLFSRANTLELVGATSIVHEDYDQLFLPDKIWRIDTNETLINKVYLHYVLQNKDVKKSFLSIATGSSSSMLNISMNKFRNILIPYPSIELQKQFEVKYNKYIETRRKLNLSKESIETLQKALSQLAFKGDLEFGKGIDLEVLLENDYNFFKENSNTKSIQLLLERLDKHELNDKKFSEQEVYDKAKEFVFELLKEGKVVQIFDKKTKRVKLTT
ncbi:restriction endonuclease subunit S [Aestuariibaculum sediminum]|uniref:Restriction endonuclease subunit S n=1 Tax=Aestuariibaculum sediminum TaxID=2770637 RepID=A0A8J6Q7L2_9FLAO|nr:restriction endonuclease subunit S [Aestuariibaculum sediminum]MBD0831830.1 restriction endonuclease subunit S [Aestuariibaculum sediminum]